MILVVGLEEPAEVEPHRIESAVTRPVAGMGPVVDPSTGLASSGTADRKLLEPVGERLAQDFLVDYLSGGRQSTSAGLARVELKVIDADTLDHVPVEVRFGDETHMLEAWGNDPFSEPLMLEFTPGDHRLELESHSGTVNLIDLKGLRAGERRDRCGFAALSDFLRVFIGLVLGNGRSATVFLHVSERR